ncbi:MAG TPA: ABC transporter permease, partial [Blastocatellia bacterium]|nr:ABC transporter permease [Blastocatellia bacterium]
GDERGVSYLNFADWQNRNSSFEAMAVAGSTEAAMVGAGEPVRARGAIVSADFFSVLGVAPQFGRAFAPEDDRAGAAGGANALMLTHGCWQRLFNGDPQVVGRRVTLDEEDYTVIGVTPAGIFPVQAEPIDFWVTVAVNGDAVKAGSANASRGYRPYAGVVARLKPGVSLAQARAEMEGVARALQAQYPESNKKSEVRVTPLRELFVSEARLLLLLLLGVVAFVLLIACVNVANLLLARATVRSREIAIRAALGASRRQIVRQLLSESLLLGLAGGVFGLLLSLWAVDGLVALLPADVPRLAGLAPDWRVLLFTFAASLLTGALCGLAPALSASKTDLIDAIKESGRSASAARGRLRAGLVVAEIALTLTLMVGAGLLVKSLVRLQQVNPGFDTRNILTAQMALTGSRYSSGDLRPDRINAFLDALRERVRQLPGVRDVSFAQCVPLTPLDNNTTFNIVERPFAKGERPAAQLRFIGLDYFSALGIALRGGRDFAERDTPQAPPVAIVNEAFAEQYFKGESPLGKRLQLGWGGDAPKEIVGVVGNVRHRSLSDQARPEMYVPQAQFANAAITLLVRTDARPEALIEPLRQQVATLDPELPLTGVKTLDRYRAEAVALPRFNALMLGLFAGLALLLTAVGLYGVMSYGVAQRTHEIGIRVALGARRRDVYRLVVGQGLKLALVGTAIGVAGALALTRLMRSLLYEVSATDPLVFAMIALVIVGVTLAACFLPARRAAKVDPVIALRRE